MKLKHVRLLKVCLVLILCFSIFPEVFFSNDNTNEKVEMSSASSEGTNSCDEHHCPSLPNEPCQNCSVCCSFPNYYVENLSIGVTFGIVTLQNSTLREDILYDKLLAKTIFHPPQTIL